LIYREEERRVYCLISIMELTFLHPLVQVESNSLPRVPKKAVARTYAAVPHRDEEGPDLLKSPATFSVTSFPSGSSTPGEERDLEKSILPGATPTHGDEPPDSGRPAKASEILLTLTDPPMTKFRFAAICTQNFLGGLTDSAPGALIPYMEK
jgi:hypothetical protein